MCIYICMYIDMFPSLHPDLDVSYTGIGPRTELRLTYWTMQPTRPWWLTQIRGNRPRFAPNTNEVWKNRRNGKTLPSSIHLELTGSQWRQSCLPRTSVAQWKIWGTLGMPLGWSVLVSISYVVFKPAFNPSGVRVLNSLQYILSYYHYSHYRYMVPSCCCDVFSNSSGMASVSWPTPSSPFQVTPQIASPAPLATLCCFRGAPKNLHMADSGSLQNVVPAKGHVHSTWSNWRNTSSKSSC